jgi:hypothetical protein
VPRLKACKKILAVVSVYICASFTAGYSMASAHHGSLLLPPFSPLLNLGPSLSRRLIFILDSSFDCEPLLKGDWAKAAKGLRDESR